MKKIVTPKSFYNSLYSKKGIEAQRKYPNEELVRFMGRNFFYTKNNDRKKIRLLETGCGSGGNLKMLAKEKFDVYGLDNSNQAINVCKKILKSKNLKAKLKIQDMENLQYPKSSMDAVIDIFSSCCLDQSSGLKYIKKVQKILKRGGIFFSYFPSKNSDTWTQERNKNNFIDPYTLKGIFRKTAPYYGNNYSLRFLSVNEYSNILKRSKFKIQYLETTSRTYRSQKEYFEFIVVEAKKI